MIDIPFIQKIAAIKARGLPFFATIDADDLSQEAIMCALRGRKSIEGPMTDLLRAQGYFGSYRSGLRTLIRVPITHMNGNDCEIFTTHKTPETILLDSEPVELPEGIKLLISKMSERKRLILKMYFTDNLTLKQISKKLHVSECRISQIKSECLRTLKHASRN